MPKKDFTQVAHRVFQQAVGDVERAPAPAPEPVKVARQKAGATGGATRAAKLAGDRRTEIAKQAAKARWGKP